jgi:hypothetical protein
MNDDVWLEEIEMKKIVINKCFGGFDLSQAALIELQKRDDSLVCQLDGFNYLIYHCVMFSKGPLAASDELERDNPNLVEVVEKLSRQANGKNAQLKVIEIPDDLEYTIEEYDGLEWVAELHRTWE